MGTLLATVVLAPGALGASPGDIYADLADGKLDGSYTQAELKAYARDAAVQGYGNPVVPVPAAGGVAGSSVGGGSVGGGSVGSGSVGQGQSQNGGGAAPAAVPPAQSPVAQTGNTGTLPFTGSELGLFALVGGGLLLGGLLLRASARNGRRNTSG